MHINPVVAALNSVSLGPDITFENLTMIPLLRDQEPPSLEHRTSNIDYVILDDALASGAAEVTEVSEHGSVPELRFLNRGPHPVLIVDGEELVGAKQNRIVNLTILVAAQTTQPIPVSCVEAGRWRARSRTFASAPRTQFASGRAKRVARVTESLRDRGDRMSDQAEVWADIADKSVRLQASSPTSAMEAIFQEHSTSLEAYVAACQPVDGQVGALFIVNGQVFGVDLFDEAATLRKLLPKLVRGVAIDAIDSGVAHPFRDAGAASSPFRGGKTAHGHASTLAAQFLAVTSAAQQHVAKAVGLGDDIRLTAPHIAGAALQVDQHVVHLAAFPL
jgi:ARG/rhodanese/phosphatase superfamily protein